MTRYLVIKEVDPDQYDINSRLIRKYPVGSIIELELRSSGHFYVPNTSDHYTKQEVETCLKEISHA